jgi:transposase
VQTPVFAPLRNHATSNRLTEGGLRRRGTVEIVVESEDTACPYCGGAMHVIGEDRSQRLDVIPAQ